MKTLKWTLTFLTLDRIDKVSKWGCWTHLDVSVSSSPWPWTQELIPLTQTAPEASRMIDPRLLSAPRFCWHLSLSVSISVSLSLRDCVPSTWFITFHLRKQLSLFPSTVWSSLGQQENKCKCWILKLLILCVCVCVCGYSESKMIYFQLNRVGVCRVSDLNCFFGPFSRVTLQPALATSSVAIATDLTAKRAVSSWRLGDPEGAGRSWLCGSAREANDPLSVWLMDRQEHGWNIRWNWWGGVH